MPRRRRLTARLLDTLTGKYTHDYGLPPGTVSEDEEKEDEKITFEVFDYNTEEYKTRKPRTVADTFDPGERLRNRWININGIHDSDVITELGEHYRLHPLLLEDITNTAQRPKFDDYESHLFVIIKMLQYNKRRREIDIEQISLILNRNTVISFQEKAGDVFDPIRQRIKRNRGRVRKTGSDYLLYSLIDMIIDQYFIVMEHVSDEIEDLEEELDLHPSQIISHKIHKLKKTLLFIRKSVWPLREVLSVLQRSDNRLIKAATRRFIRDAYEHTIHVIESLDTFRDMLSGMLDLYLSFVSNRLNEVMKVLTVITTIFIPLSFVSGVYGMNFKFMPEVSWRYGYFVILGVMALIAGLMVAYFRRKKWI